MTDFINTLSFIFLSVPYAVDRTALKAMLERHGEEIKKKLEEFAEIMKKEHVRILKQYMLLMLCVGIKISKHCRKNIISTSCVSALQLSGFLHMNPPLSPSYPV